MKIMNSSTRWLLNWFKESRTHQLKNYIWKLDLVLENAVKISLCQKIKRCLSLTENKSSSFLYTTIKKKDSRKIYLNVDKEINYFVGHSVDAFLSLRSFNF